MPTRNVNLTDHFNRFIDRGINSGRYSNASEMIREGLRLLERRDAEHRARIQWLRSAAQEGFAAVDRGDFEVLRSEEDLDQFLEAIQSGVPTDLARESKRA